MKKVYVAGASKDLERAKAVMGQIAVSSELTIVCDWTKDFDTYTGIPEHDLDARVRRQCMDRDVRAVLAADYIHLLAPSPDKPTKGAWFELGVAHLAAMSHLWGHQTIVISGEHRFCSIFTECAHEFFEYDIDAIRWMEQNGG